ncbi:MAG: 16S rRNA (cytosine(1402)-N(4))-methyltransferase RsmH [Dysgonamonadaceae bacterium]|jgi:16S rRNA (cytosine1402-N4)-methyltransferase|nr:16S rRNA (cytosine(1402)-N(4))-methyltransferase RsmH [Dysgonamonadaceae bacterium]
MKTEPAYHVPVLLKESVDGLNIRPDGVYADLTFGGGGHSREILNRLSENGRLFGFDQDEDALQNAPDDRRFTFVRSNFRFLENFMDWYGIDGLDGILADLGVSWHHFDDETRGFSFRFDSNLDMRMNRQGGKTAADILNTYSEQALADMFYRFGELRCSRALARAAVKFRENRKIGATSDFLEIARPFFSREKEKKQMAQAFQALRIEVNDEAGALAEMLIQAGRLLKNGGRMAVITYHSLEDRLVKNFFRSGNLEGKVEKDFYGNLLTPFRLINNKVIVPDAEEQEKNPRSRSAKLRIAEKNG